MLARPVGLCSCRRNVAPGSNLGDASGGRDPARTNHLAHADGHARTDSRILTNPRIRAAVTPTRAPQQHGRHAHAGTTAAQAPR